MTFSALFAVEFVGLVLAVDMAVALPVRRDAPPHVALEARVTNCTTIRTRVRQTDTEHSR